MALGMRLRNTTLAPKAPTRCVRPVVCQAKPEQSSPVNFIALPVVSLVTAAMLSSAILPLDAFASNSSGGRVGRSSFSARRSSPPAQSYSAPRTTTVTNVYSAPSVVVAPVVAPSPFGFGGFGFGGGYGYYPAPVVGVPIFGGLFQLFALVLLASVLFGVVRAFFSSQGKAEKKDDTWGDL